jgi:hypothetical protein
MTSFAVPQERGPPGDLEEMAKQDDPTPAAGRRPPWTALLIAGAILVVGGIAVAVKRDDTGETAAKPATARAAATTPATPTPAVDGASKPADPATPGAPAVPAGPAGKMEIKETTFNAGTVDRGVKVVHAFEIKNVGEHDLTVDAKPG